MKICVPCYTEKHGTQIVMILMISQD